MSTYVVDASVVAKWFFPEIHAEAASRLRDTRHTLHAPDFLVLEFGSIVTKRVRRGEIRPASAVDLLGALHAAPVQLHAWAAYMDVALSLAIETSRSLYDCLYLALTQVLGGQLVTADRKFLDALQGYPSSKDIIWVEDLPL